MRKRGAFCCCVVFIAICFYAAGAYAEEAIHRFEIPASNANTGLNLLAKQSNTPLLYLNDEVRNERTNDVKGSYTVHDALEILLKDTGISGSINQSGVLTIAMTEPEQNEGKSMKTKPNRTKTSIFAAFSAAFLSVLSPAIVSGEEAEDKTGASMMLEEIIVTATKRAASIQDIPMSISVITKEDMARRGLAEMDDYLRTLPGVSMVARGAGQNVVIIRGVAAAPELEGSDSATVGVYFDEYSVTGLVGPIDLKMVDLERVEVLRGPQGTLYGAGSMGGTVRNISASPNLEKFEGKLETSYSKTARQGDDNTMFQGVVSIPLIENQLAVRAVAYRYQDSGYIDNIARSNASTFGAANAFGAGDLAVDQNNVGNEVTEGGRASILWQANDKLSLQLTRIMQDTKQEGLPEISSSLGKFQQARLQLGDVVGGRGERLNNNVDITNLEVNYDLGWAHIMSSTSWVESLFLQDTDISGPFGGLPFSSTTETERDVSIEEIRLTSDLEGPFQFMLGGYYEDADEIRESATIWGGAPELHPFFPPGSNPPALLSKVDFRPSIKQIAIFSELSYQLTEQWEFTLGARIFNYDRKIVSTVANQTSPSGPPTSVFNSLKIDESGETFKANITYAVSDDILLYGQWAEGFRLGLPEPALDAALCDMDGDGFVDGLNGITINTRRLDSDTLDSFELGAKFTLFDNRLVINTAVYRVNWEGIPIRVLGTICGANINAGKARTQGFEFASTVYLARSLRANIGGSYVDAELSRDAQNLGMAGDRLPGSAEYTLNLGLQYDFTLAAYDSFIRSDYAYVGGFYNNLQETGVEAGDYQEWNVSGGITFDNIEVSLIVRNLNNADAMTWVSTAPDRSVFRLRPRTLGLNVRYRF